MIASVYTITMAARSIESCPAYSSKVRSGIQDGGGIDKRRALIAICTTDDKWMLVIYERC